MSDSSSSPVAPAATGVYYDRLERWTALARFLGFGGGRETLTVHRALADPRTGGRTTATRLHDLLFESLPAWSAPRVLDAGCGLGGTLLDLASRMGGPFTGLTLSDRQAQIGRRAIARAGLEDRVAIHVGSYDEPRAESFDLIYAIESLAHSPDPAVSVRALAGSLAAGGMLVIVDDMPEAGAVETRDLATFKKGWRLPVLWGVDEYATCLRECGLSVATRDLTSEVRPRTHGQIARLEAINRVAHHLSWSHGLRQMLDSYHGGLALERLYRDRLMSYKLVIATADHSRSAERGGNESR